MSKIKELLQRDALSGRLGNRGEQLVDNGLIPIGRVDPLHGGQKLFAINIPVAVDVKRSESKLHGAGDL